VGQDGAILRSYEWLVSKERNGGRSEPEMSFGRCYSHLRDVVNHMEGTRGSFPPVLRLVLLLRSPFRSSTKCARDECPARFSFRMKTILILGAFAFATLFVTGCSTSASVGHEGHRHGVSTSASTRGPGAGVGARVY
jgi:hypothetical protein